MPDGDATIIEQKMEWAQTTFHSRMCNLFGALTSIVKAMKKLAPTPGIDSLASRMTALDTMIAAATDKAKFWKIINTIIIGIKMFSMLADVRTTGNPPRACKLGCLRWLTTQSVLNVIVPEIDPETTPEIINVAFEQLCTNRVAPEQRATGEIEHPTDKVAYWLRRSGNQYSPAIAPTAAGERFYGLCVPIAPDCYNYVFPITMLCDEVYEFTAKDPTKSVTLMIRGVEEQFSGPKLRHCVAGIIHYFLTYAIVAYGGEESGGGVVLNDIPGVDMKVFSKIIANTTEIMPHVDIVMDGICSSSRGAKFDFASMISKIQPSTISKIASVVQSGDISGAMDNASIGTAVEQIKKMAGQ